MINRASFVTGRRQGGFTMVELAVVLVIAGIILTAVLKGTDMINKAKIERLTADLRGLQGMLLEHEKRTGKLPGDCDENGIIGFTGFPADNVSNNSTTPPYNTDGDPDAAGRCVGTGTAETDVNLVWSDLRKANIVDPSRTNRQLSKHILQDYYTVGSVTPTAPGTPDAVNAIVVYGVPLWLAKGIDVAMDGAQSGTTATDALRGGARGRIRLYYPEAGPVANGGGGASWPTDAIGSGDYQIVSFIYYFDTRMPLPTE